MKAIHYTDRSVSKSFHAPISGIQIQSAKASAHSLFCVCPSPSG
jgi:hypothetical protein